MMNSDVAIAEEVMNKPTGLKCPYCGGEILSNPFMYVCENAESGNCNFSIRTGRGKIKVSDVKDLVEKKITRKISGICYSNSKDRFYDAALKLNEKGAKTVWSYVFGEDMSGISCPYCGKPVVDRRSSFECADFRENECKFYVSRYDGKFSLDDLKTLISRKKTGVIKKICYSKKKGKYFDAAVVLNPKVSDMATSFSFPRPAKRTPYYCEEYYYYRGF